MPGDVTSLPRAAAAGLRARGRRNSGSSSRNRTPLWARLTSPGRGRAPPPTRAACARRVVGAAEGPRMEQPVGQEARRRVDGGRLEGLLRCAGREGCRQAARQHRLPGARADPRAVGCDRPRRRPRGPGAPGAWPRTSAMSAAVVRRLRAGAGARWAAGLGGRTPATMSTASGRRRRREHVDAGDDRGLPCVRRGNDGRAQARSARAMSIMGSTR